MAYLKVRVTPGARESALNGWQGDVLRLKVREKAERGRANEATARLLADLLAVAPSQLALKRGATSREKLFEIDGLTDAEVRHRLGAPAL